MDKRYVTLVRTLYYNKQSVECFGYMGTTDEGASVVMWRVPGEPKLWFAELYLKVRTGYWGTFSEVMDWLSDTHNIHAQVPFKE